MCLNLWQIRNETLAVNNDKLNYIKERNDLLKQANDIQLSERSDIINSKFKDTLTCSYAILTTLTNERLQQWITMAILATKYDPNLAGGHSIIRAITILPPQTPDNRNPDKQTPEIPLPGAAT